MAGGEGGRGEGFTPSPPQRGEEKTQTRSGEWAGGLTRGDMVKLDPADGGLANSHFVFGELLFVFIFNRAAIIVRHGICSGLSNSVLNM